MTEEPGRVRKEFVLEAPLNPLSLIGSWFHRLEDGDITTQGLVVAEAQPGIYLLELVDVHITDLVDVNVGERKWQKLVKIDQMLTDDWRFFDSELAMREAYSKHRGEIEA